MIITMNKGSALILRHHGDLIGTVYFKDEENVDIMTITPNCYMISRNFACIYFTEYKVKENFLEQVEVSK